MTVIDGIQSEWVPAKWTPEAVAAKWTQQFGAARWEDYLHEQCLDTLCTKAKVRSLLRSQEESTQGIQPMLTHADNLSPRPNRIPLIISISGVSGSERPGVPKDLTAQVD